MRQIVEELDRVQSYLKDEVEHVDRMTDLHTRNHVDRHLTNVEHSALCIEAGLSKATQDIALQAEVAANSREKQEYSENGTDPLASLTCYLTSYMSRTPIQKFDCQHTSY